MKIAVVTHDPDAMAETYVRHHIRSLAPGNTCVIFRHGEGRSVADLPHYRLDVASGPWSWPAKLWNLLRFGYTAAPSGIQGSKLIHFLREQQVELVYAEFGPNGSLMWSVCQRLGIPLLVNFHGYDATVMPRQWKTRWAYGFWKNKVQAVICGSTHFKQVVASLGFPAHRIHVIPCGTDTGTIVPGTASQRRVIAVGRLTPKKAPQLTISAFAKVLKVHPELEMDVVGDGSLRAACVQLVKELGLEGKVHLHGALAHDQVGELLSRAYLFVQHSIVGPDGDTESQGISLIEAMAAGLPVVCTDHNGFRETNLHGQTGFLVPEQDVDGMADRMLEILDRPELHHEMSQAARMRAVEVFDHRHIDERLRHLLQSTINEYAR